MRKVVIHDNSNALHETVVTPTRRRQSHRDFPSKQEAHALPKPISTAEEGVDLDSLSQAAATPTSTITTNAAQAPPPPQSLSKGDNQSLTNKEPSEGDLNPSSSQSVGKGDRTLATLSESFSTGTEEKESSSLFYISSWETREPLQAISSCSSSSSSYDGNHHPGEQRQPDAVHYGDQRQIQEDEQRTGPPLSFSATRHPSAVTNPPVSLPLYHRQSQHASTRKGYNPPSRHVLPVRPSRSLIDAASYDSWEDEEETSTSREVSLLDAVGSHDEDDDDDARRRNDDTEDDTDEHGLDFDRMRSTTMEYQSSHDSLSTVSFAKEGLPKFAKGPMSHLRNDSTTTMTNSTTSNNSTATSTTPMMKRHPWMSRFSRKHGSSGGGRGVVGACVGGSGFDGSDGVSSTSMSEEEFLCLAERVEQKKQQRRKQRGKQPDSDDTGVVVGLLGTLHQYIYCIPGMSGK